MPSKEITLEFDLENGEVKSEAHNYEGQACSADMGPILAAVGQEKARRPKQREQHATRTIQIGKK